jgi:hypothetical protein
MYFLALVMSGGTLNARNSFLNPTVLQQLDLPVPSRDLTPHVLEPLNLNHAFEPSKDLLAYRKLYGLIRWTVNNGKAMSKCHCSNCMSKYLTKL